MQAAERDYLEHDDKRLAMIYALDIHCVYLLRDRPFVVYTDHASLGTVENSPHLSQRMVG